MAACTLTAAEHFPQGRIVTEEFWRKTMLAGVDVDVSANTNNVAGRLDVASSA